MDIRDICINCFRPTGGEEVCMNCGYIQTDRPKQICHLYPKTILNDRYIIGRVINNGGFGVVYKAYDMRLENVVAIKELLPTQNSMVTRMPPSTEVLPVNDDRREMFTKLKQRFMKEARVMAKFSECNSIVRIYDFFEANNTVYLVMEFLEGMTLRQYIDSKEKKMSFDAAMKIMMPIMQALKVVHSEGIVHKDISPDNIFICDDGSVKLIDFGAAQFPDDENDDSYNNVVMKLGYTPPEQYRANTKVGPYSDVYSVGAVLYAVLSGTIPPESIDRLENDNLQKLTKIGVQLPIYADKAIMKAMAVKETARFNSISDFIDAITGKKKADFPEVEIRKKRIRNTLVVVVLIGAMIGSVLTTYFVKTANSIIPRQNTTITVWYIDEGNELANKRWEKIESDYSSFVKGQNSKLTETKVKIVGIPEDEYEEKLQKAFKDGNAPDVYQSVDDTFDDNSASLKPLYKMADSQSFCSAYDVMKETYKDNNKIAVTFDTPVLYTYTDNTKNSVPDEKTELTDLINTKKLSGFTRTVVCDPEVVMYAAYAYGNGQVKGADAEQLFDCSKTYDSKGKYIHPQNLFTKKKDNAMFYIGNISEYNDVSNKCRIGFGSFTVSNLTGSSVKTLYSYPEVWSVSEDSSSVNKSASQLFLYYLLCTDAGQQNIMKFGTSTHYLPMLLEAKNSVGFVVDLSFIYDKKADECVAVPYEDIKETNEKTQTIIEKSKKKGSNYNDIF